MNELILVNESCAVDAFRRKTKTRAAFEGIYGFHLVSLMVNKDMVARYLSKKILFETFFRQFGIWPEDLFEQT